jgi:hypothetical protein
MTGSSSQSGQFKRQVEREVERQVEPEFEPKFKPEMPRIPGVNEPLRARQLWKKPDVLKWLAVAIVVVVGGVVWSGIHAARYRAESAKAMRDSAPARSTADVPTTLLGPPPAARKDVAAATIADLAKPWSAKEFEFFNPLTHARVPAMIIRLPGSPSRASAYWAFSLEAPYETCRLSYVTDFRALASRYHYRANHPMVVASCDGAVYDPLQLGTTPAGAWVPGEVVQGGGSRPPLAIGVRVQGQSIFADRIE